MDTRRKACPNENCETYRKKKFDSKINYCPICGEKLIYVCASMNCYNPIEDKGPKHRICELCTQERKDLQDKVVNYCKKGGNVAIAFIGGAVAVFTNTLKNSGEKELNKIAKNTANDVINKVKTVVKK